MLIEMILKPTILCVDDEADNTDALERLFRKNFRVLKAASGAEALSIISQEPQPIALIISDQKMPHMTGVEFLEKSIELRPDTMRILLTGYTDLDSVIQAVNKGQIYRYLTKPWDSVDLLNTVEYAVQQFTLKSELSKKNQELATALAELKTLDQAKSQFMLLINHELKTPLTTILSYSQLLGESLKNEDDLKLLKRIQQGSERLQSLIEDVLLIVRAETGQLHYELQPHQFQTIEDLIPSLLLEEAQKKKMRFLLHFEQSPIVCDARILRQVFQRLVQNAIRFGNPDTDIQITKSRIPDGFMFAVKNEGPTIPTDRLQQIMKPFFIDENILHHSQGTGLGLSITQSLLKSMNSHLKMANSATGVVAQFKLSQ